jgi:hypothetical protein
MSQEANLSAIEEGIRAVAVAGAISDVIEDTIRVHVTSLIAMYRQGGIDHDMLIGKVAEIAAMEALLSNLESKARRGDAAANREYNNGTQA